MNFTALFNFLEELQQNNNKDWMDANRNWYEEVRDSFIGWLDTMNDSLSALDPDYYYTPGKKAINRINNNLLFHPNRPVYKDHFGAGLDQLSKQGDFYIELGVNGSFAGGGYWHPSSGILRSIRDAIDYDGERFKAILNKVSFKETFNGLIPSDALKTAPKGFTSDHPHIELLRMKSFAAVRNFSKKEVTAPDFNEKVLTTYMELLPFRRYLNKAVTV
jgi:uncharacterized protein (TIGR02453 family)